MCEVEHAQSDHWIAAVGCSPMAQARGRAQLRTFAGAIEPTGSSRPGIGFTSFVASRARKCVKP